MPSIGSLRPVTSRILGKLGPSQRIILGEAMDHARQKHYRKAATLFDELARQMDAGSSEVSEDTPSMKADSSLVLAKMEIGRDRNRAEQLLIQVCGLLDLALKPDPYWADYLFTRDATARFLHGEFGCKIIRRAGSWPVNCIAVSNALHIPGISRAETFDLECSICGKDPIECPHIALRVYDGRLAQHVVRNLKPEHLAIMIDRQPEERNIGFYPRDLTDADIRDFFPEGQARMTLRTGMLRCKDLIHAIRIHRLGGVNFVRPSSQTE